MTFFRRGSGPLCSVQIPSRGRSPWLLRAVDSMYSLARDKSLFEFVIRADEDDLETIKTVREKLEPILRVKLLVGPRGRGYADMATWVNEMTAAAEGDWIFFFNDDARMTSQDWDQRLLCTGTTIPWIGIDDVCMVVAPTLGRPHAQEFMFIRRRTFEILGRFGTSPHADNWMHGVMNFVGAVLTDGEMAIEHDSHLIGDKTREESVEAYKTSIGTLTSRQAVRSRLRDSGLLLDHMERTERRMLWQGKPNRSGWWWFRKPGAIAKHVLVQEVKGELMALEARAEGERMNFDPMAESEGEWSLRHD